MEESDLAPVVVELKSVTKQYELASGAVVVLDNVDLQITQGAIVAVKGVSGSGKSTLLHLLAAIDRPTTGSVIVDGYDLSNLRPRQQADFRARSIGFVFQFFNLMPTLTVAENVASGLEPLHWKRRIRDEAVREALNSVELLDQANKYPAQISGGQQQRAAIARAIAKKPPILLADEPTGALDVKTARVVLEYLKKMQSQMGCTLVIATHDPVVADFADTVYRVGGGIMERER
ncbi:MAG: ABC transporter ATP-binding protein [Propionibacteriaceae bacterium]|nr:ABC transporter ATP-binding protein [Propionibacteriaceae bacterium]